MSEKRVYNFAAGPSNLPLQVLERAKSELINYGGSGMSVMEMSHRSKLFISIFERTKADLRRILNVPDTHEILFLQGGATLQFAMTAMNLITRTGKADYVLTGSFAEKAYKEAQKYGDVAVAASTKQDGGYTRIPTQDELNVRSDASYLYYTANNTIYGTEWKYTPKADVPLVCDMSSDILTQPIEFDKYSLVYAGAQKNMSPAGLTVVFVNRDYVGHALPYTPVMLDYATMIKGDSMYNTPPCWCIYMLGLTLQWMDEQGGLAEIERRKKEKAELLYNVLDKSDIFHACAEKGSRSDMNVTFVSGDAELDKRFVDGAKERGIVNIAGHRSVGGMRASIYNAMSLDGVKALAEYITEFRK